MADQNHGASVDAHSGGRFYDSSPEDTDDVSISTTHHKRLDYMLQFLDRKLSMNSSTTRDQPLPEFTCSGRAAGVFKPTPPVHPNRPPSLDIRPQPLRETQVGRFLRNIVCVDGEIGTQMWAGSERGVRVWDLRNDLYGGGGELDEEGVVEEEGTARYFESEPVAGATLCVVGDGGNRVVWSGHKDGRIRCWKMMDFSGNTTNEEEFREMFSWQAHRGAVLSMVVSVYGDIWSGSEGGEIKIWPWEAIEKSLSLEIGESHMSALLLERSNIDLKSQVILSGATSNIFTSDIRYMLSDNGGAKVWSASYQLFALWDARSRELLKVVDIDGQIENLSPDSVVEDEMKIVSGSNEKVPNPFNFFQRTRNVILGAADAVRRAAVKGAFGDDNRRTEAAVATIDGMIWSGCANGSLLQWDGNGNRLRDLQYHSFSVQTLCTVGSRIWVGYMSGTLQVLDLNGDLLGEWVAHNSPVIDLAAGAGYVFSLANHGAISGWSVTSPGPLDSMLRPELAEKEFLYLRLENLKILAGTWNVGQGRAAPNSLTSWLGSAAADVDIVVVGLQEVEMGAGFLAMSAAKETIGVEGSAAGQWWLDMIGKTLDEGSTFSRVGSRQLAGLLISVWVRYTIKGHVGDIDVAAVPCGFGRAIGNKGAVGLRMRVYSRVMCFVNCHFAAHLEAVNRRNADFDHVYRTMVFSRLNAAAGMVLRLFLCCLLACSMYILLLVYGSRLPLALSLAAGVSSAILMLRNTNSIGINPGEGTPELSEADMVMFLGDFNYRLNGISYDEAKDFISRRSLDKLKERDQLRKEMKAGNVFQGMREAVIRFPPTYKFDRHKVGLAAYDSGEQKRIPAWCDRILYRDSRSASVSTCSLDCPVVSSVLKYDASMDVTDSDHKPVRGIFKVDVARVDESIRRQEFGEIIRSNEKIKGVIDELCRVPEVIISSNNIILQDQDVSILRITNKSTEDRALFEISCECQSTMKEDGKAPARCSRGCFGFPPWLEVKPAAGIIKKTDNIAEISIRHVEYQTFRESANGVQQKRLSENDREKEVMLVLKVHGSCTSNPKCHHIRLQYKTLSNFHP